MNEKQLQSLYTKWIREQIELGKMETFVYELKIKPRGKRLNFKSDLRPQQIPSLLQTKHSCLSHKISDFSMMDSKPFDGFVVCREPAYLVVCWYEPRKPKILYHLDPDIINDMIKSGKKSISEDEANIIKDFYKII